MSSKLLLFNLFLKPVFSFKGSVNATGKFTCNGKEQGGVRVELYECDWKHWHLHFLNKIPDNFVSWTLSKSDGSFVIFGESPNFYLRITHQCYDNQKLKKKGIPLTYMYTGDIYLKSDQHSLFVGCESNELSTEQFSNAYERFNCRPISYGEKSFHRRKQLRLENVDEICLHELISANPRLQVKEGSSINGKSTQVFVKSKEDCLSQNDKLITMRLPVKENLDTLHPNASSTSETVDDEVLEDLQTEILFGGDYEEASRSEDFTHIEGFSNLVLQDSVKVTQDEDQTGLKDFFVQGFGSFPAEAVSINQPTQMNQSSQGFSRSNLNSA